MDLRHNFIILNNTYFNCSLFLITKFDSFKIIRVSTWAKNMVKLKTTGFIESIFVCENTSSKIRLESNAKTFF